MITDPASLQKLRFRSDLPRLQKEGFSVFAQLEPGEQQRPEAERVRLLMGAFAAQVAEEEKLSSRPLPELLPRAYRAQPPAGDFVEYECAFALAEPYERRARDGSLLAVTRFVRGRVRVFKGAFAYSSPEDSRPLEALDTTGWVQTGS